jgi:uncharacterized membrane protein YcgQ (UPF0703/DUF1980 family)
MRSYHISSRGLRSIDVKLVDEKNMVEIVDSYNSKNRIIVSSEDWNELVKKIREREIGFVGEEE